MHRSHTTKNASSPTREAENKPPWKGGALAGTRPQTRNHDRTSTTARTHLQRDGPLVGTWVGSVLESWLVG